MDGNGCTIECPMNNLYVECSYTESVFSVFHSEKKWEKVEKKLKGIGQEAIQLRGSVVAMIKVIKEMFGEAF